jgi:hypothetical protein
MTKQAVKIELSAVIVALVGTEPQILVDQQGAIPSGPFETDHRTLEQGLRSWAGLPLGYVEQLYTFADKDRHRDGDRIISIGYLALMQDAALPRKSTWSSWYRHFPWEDHRKGFPLIISKQILPVLNIWKSEAADVATKRVRASRIAIAFPEDKKRWNEELVLQRYELLWEAGLVFESPHFKKRRAHEMGVVLAQDHRRIVATAMARLRAKIKYRPVVFELMSDHFTLLQLQLAVEALGGLRLHKQNFRRLVESQGLVEETGASIRAVAGRPAKLFAFRREVLQQRAVVGTKLPRSQ